MKKGFTLIELMIVIAIIAIIAAIAIPNLMASRIRANEATAIAAVKAYCAAQVTFQVARYGSNGGTPMNGAITPNGYTADFPFLAYGAVPAGTGTGTKLGLISDVFGSAVHDATATKVTAAIVTAAGGPTLESPYQGYQYAQPADGLANGAAYYNLNYAIAAAPADSNTTGNNAYWCGIQGSVYLMGVPQNTNAKTLLGTTITNTPVTVPVPTGWIVL